MRDLFTVDTPVAVHHGDALAVLGALPDASVHAVITDPPYGLADHRPEVVAAALVAWASGDRERVPTGSRPQGAKNCAAHVLGRAEGDVLDADVEGGQLGVKFRVTVANSRLMPVLRAIQLDHEAMPGQVEVDGEGASLPSDEVLVGEGLAQAGEHAGHETFRLGKARGAAVCVGTCAHFRLPRSGVVRVAVRLGDHAQAVAGGAPEVVALAAAELRAVLTLDLGRLTGELTLADSADEGHAGLFLARTQGVGAGARAGGLSAVSEPRRVGEVPRAADGALAFDLLLHGDLHALVSRPSVSPTGFMGRAWDAFVPPPAVWDECLRVLVPGGHLAVFAGSRTADLMGLSIRLAGFEMRDGIAAWLYGSGFPKSLDVGKAVDKAAVASPLWDSIRAHLRYWRDQAGLTNADLNRAVGSATSGCGMARHWTSDGGGQHSIPSKAMWATLRDALGWPWGELDDVYDAVKDGAERPVVGERTTGRGTGRGDTAIIGDSANRDITAPATDAAREWSGWGTALKPAHEPVILARKPLALATGRPATVAANVLAHRAGAINVDAARVNPPCPACGAPASSPRSPRGSALGTDAAALAPRPDSAPSTPAAPSACSSADTGPGRESERSRHSPHTDAPAPAGSRPERRTDLLASDAGHAPTNPSPQDSPGSCPTSPRSDGAHAPSAGEGDRAGARPRPDAPGCPDPRDEPARSPSETRSTACPECTARHVDSPGRWPTNVVLAHRPLVDPDTGEAIGDACADGCVPGCQVAALDDQAGGRSVNAAARWATSSAGSNDTATYGDGINARAAGDRRGGYGDEGGPSRYFPTFRYQAKAPKRERPIVDGLGHPTVKPLGLMRWLVDLLVAPGGVVLDPFAGSGSTLQAARDEGVTAIGVEADEHSIRLIRQRLDLADEEAKLG